MKRMKNQISLLVIVAMVLLGLTGCLRGRRVNQYDAVETITLSIGGGYGVLEEMTQSEYIFSLTDNTVTYILTRLESGELLEQREYAMDTLQTENIRNIVKRIDFLTLPEDYGDDMAEDAPYICITIIMGGEAHKTGGFMPGETRFNLMLDCLQDTYRQVSEEGA